MAQPLQSFQPSRSRGIDATITSQRPGRMRLKMGARSSRPLPSASRRRAGSNRLSAPIGEWDLFGETPNRATGTVALPFSDRYGSSESKSKTTTSLII